MKKIKKLWGSVKRFFYLLFTLQISKIVERITRKKYTWNKSEDEKLKKKQYNSYEEYVEHQKSKLDVLKDRDFFKEYDKNYEKVLFENLKLVEDVRQGATVLCLAARVGTEVRSFKNHGCFAIGIDLNPGEGNKHVVVGDFHDLQFADNSVDIAFTNSLDHVFNLDRFIKEARRVLKPEGVFILEIPKGESEGGEPRYWESMYWDSVDDVVEVFAENDLNLEKKDTTAKPVGKFQIVMRKK